MKSSPSGREPDVKSDADVPVVGVLALQGDVREHRAVLESLGAIVVEVRQPRDLLPIDALVLPGGESTTVSMLLDSARLFEPIAQRLASGMPAFGTCAGMIVLAKEVLDGRADQRPIGAIDITVRRNAFGRQLESFEADLDVREIGAPPMHAVFIRAPIVESVGVGVSVLSDVDIAGSLRAVVCRQGRVTVAAFHPELTGDRRLHALLIDDARAWRREEKPVVSIDALASDSPTRRGRWRDA